MNTAAAAERGPGGRDHHSLVTPYTRRSTTDCDEAEQVISELFLPNRLDLTKGSGPLDMEVTGLRLGALTAGRLTYGRPVSLRTADADSFHVNLPLRGRVASRRGSEPAVTTGPGQGLVFSPGAPAQMAWSAGCEQLCLMIPPARLEAELERLLGRALRGRLTYDFRADLGGFVGGRWGTVLDLLLKELDHPTELSRSAHVGQHVEGLVLDGLLLGVPHSHSAAAFGTPGPGMTKAIRRAVDLLEERPGHPWTTVRLAAEVHLSVRALQEGFRRHLATPPMTYLRQVRLRRARAALQEAHRDATTVGAVAASLGIVHLGRFAATYREAFGESPSVTLSRHP